MGLFSGEKIITVASTVYNMAGEEKDRPQYLQSLMMRNILSGSKDSVGTTIQNGYLNGPAIRLRQFFKWARKPKNYGAVGMPTGTMASGTEIDPKSVEIYIGHPGGTEVWCQHALVGNPQYAYWSEEWIMNNRPGDLDKAWGSSYNSKTNKITIRFGDDSTVIFTPYNYYTNWTYVYAYYIIVSNPGTDNISFGPDRLFIYRVGSGYPGLDAVARRGSSYGEFFPFIPVRINNQFLSNSYEPTAYHQATKAYQKSTGGHFEELIASLKDNKDLKDIDYAYVVFGVSLNVIEMSCKRYLYMFFDKLRYSQYGGPNPYNEWLKAVDRQEEIYKTWRRWKARGNTGGHDSQNDPEPQRPRMGQLAKNQIQITGKSSLDTDYDIRLQWAYISGGQGGGRGRAGARKNDCWIVYLGDDHIARTYYTSSNIYGQANDETYTKFRIYWQRSANLYTYLDVVGMRHENMIYGGKSVTIGAREALQDNDESGFIIPLHYETWRDTPIIDSSQMGTACVFIVLNSYKVTKRKWYESGIFRIFLIIIIAIASVVFTGGAGLGLLGAHLSVGAALGFTGMTAAIVGSVVNALVAMVLTTIIQKVASAFGVIGPIIATILGIVVGGMINAFQVGGTFAFDWTSMFRVDNLIKLTNSVNGSVAEVMKAETLAAQQKIQDLSTQSEEQLKKIEQAYVDQFGYGTINLAGIAQVAGVSDILVSESSSTFLARTTLTGSDIADMSVDIVHNFADYSLKLPDAFA